MTQNMIGSQSKSRIGYIDAMRGFTMILVVYHHVILYVLQIDSTINSVFIMFRMPLFFFISGFMAYSKEYTQTLFVKRLKNRAYGQLIPTVVVGLLYVAFIQSDLKSFGFDLFKHGYWFTYCMFQVFVVYAVLTFGLDLLGCTARQKTVAYLCLIFMAYAFLSLLFVSDVFEHPVFKVLSTVFVLKYMLYFLLGVICKTYFETFCKFINRNDFSSPLLIICIVIIALWGYNPITKLLLGIMGIFIVYRIFRFYQDKFNGNNALGNVLCYIGRHTLEIYLVHTFFIEGFKQLGGKGLSALCAENWCMELVVGFSLAIVITSFCLVVMKVTQTAPLLNKLLFGLQK